MTAVATAIVGGAVVGGIISGSAAQNAASTEANAANNATGAEEGMFATEQANAQPYIQAGDQALTEINQNMPGWNAAATPTAAEVEATPGYQFQMQQTLANLGASESAQGAGYGTGTMAAMANYASNVASTGYNQAFSNYQTSIQNAYGRLAGIAQIGGNAVSGLNSNATQIAGSIGNNITGAGTASAAGTIGSANAINSSIGTATNGIMYNNLMGNLMNRPSTVGQPTAGGMGDMPQLQPVSPSYNPGYNSAGQASPISSLY